MLLNYYPQITVSLVISINRFPLVIPLTLCMEEHEILLQYKPAFCPSEMKVALFTKSNAKFS